MPGIWADAVNATTRYSERRLKNMLKLWKSRPPAPMITTRLGLLTRGTPPSGVSCKDPRIQRKRAKASSRPPAVRERRSGSHSMDYLGKTQQLSHREGTLSRSRREVLRSRELSGSGAAGADPIGDLRGGESGHERDHVDVPSGALDLVFPHDARRSVIPALHEHVREELLDEPKGGLLVEENDVIDARQRGHDRGARLLPLDGTA